MDGEYNISFLRQQFYLAKVNINITLSLSLPNLAERKKMSQQKASLIVIPFPVISHLFSAIKMAELLADRDDRLSVTVLIMKLQSDPKITSYINNWPESRVNFVQIESREHIRPGFSEIQNRLFKEAIAAITGGARLAGLFFDILGFSMTDLAADLGAPSFVFFTCGAAVLGLTFSLHDLIQGRHRHLAEYEDSDAEVAAPTYVNPVPAKLWPGTVFDRNGFFYDLTKKLREASGIVVNTFLEFEPYAITALAGDSKIPAVYPVGPLLQEQTDDGGGKKAEILRWLDEQPHSSVVFLCFGTHGCFNKAQVTEIATALEGSQKRFLWSLRKPPSNRTVNITEYDNPAEVLPDGFLERTAAIGKIIGWAPQMAVLSHRAVGGFVSHCGWNSILESVWCGVPIATWPMYAEQQTNAFQLVKELEIAVEIKMDYRKNTHEIVNAHKIEKAINQLMDPKNKIRVNVQELKEKSRNTLLEDGSSYNFTNRLIEDVLKNHVF